MIPLRIILLIAITFLHSDTRSSIGCSDAVPCPDADSKTSTASPMDAKATVEPLSTEKKETKSCAKTSSTSEYLKKSCAGSSFMPMMSSGFADSNIFVSSNAFGGSGVTFQSVGVQAPKVSTDFFMLGPFYNLDDKRSSTSITNKIAKCDKDIKYEGNIVIKEPKKCGCKQTVKYFQTPKGFGETRTTYYQNEKFPSIGSQQISYASVMNGYGNPGLDFSPNVRWQGGAASLASNYYDALHSFDIPQPIYQSSYIPPLYSFLA